MSTTKFLWRLVGFVAVLFGLLVTTGLVLAAETALPNRQPVRLDPAFGNGGSVRLALPQNIGVSAMRLQTDGRIVVGGLLRDPNGSLKTLLLARFLENGALDLSFGSSGILTQTLSGIDTAVDLLAQPDGRWLVLGRTLAPKPEDFVLACYLEDGSPDSSFGNGGLVITDLSGASDAAQRLARQPDGRLLAAGASGAGIGLVRYLPDGSLDATFGVNGIQTLELQATNESAAALAFLPEGKILVGGSLLLSSGSNPGNYAFVLQLQANGDPDLDFGLDGLARKAFSSNFPLPNALLVQPDSGILLAGMVGRSGHINQNYFLLERWLSDGSLDPAFCGSCQDWTGSEGIRALLLQPDGKLLLAASHDEQAWFVRDLANGQPDGDFGEEGVLQIITGNFNLIQRDNYGRLLLAGATLTSGLPDGLLLARYLPERASIYLPQVQR